MKTVDIFEWKKMRGGEGSGNFGHEGRPGSIGGSGGEGSGEVDKSIEIVKKLVMSGGGGWGDLGVNNEVENILKKTVDDKQYKVYRGLHLMKSRMSIEQYNQIKELKVGDVVPDFLRKQGNDFSSSSLKLSVANYYAKEGNIELIMTAELDRSQVFVDTTNLKDVMTDMGRTNDFSEDDYNYFRTDKEIIFKEPVKFTVHSNKVNK